VAAVGTSYAIYIIMSNLKKARVGLIHLSNERSWFLKKLFAWIHLGGVVLGLLIYLGEVDLKHKPLVEYTTVIATSLFFWSFSLDFKNFTMDVEKIAPPVSSPAA
jgi:hypothetical protein